MNARFLEAGHCRLKVFLPFDLKRRIAAFAELDASQYGIFWIVFNEKNLDRVWRGPIDGGFLVCQFHLDHIGKDTRSLSGFTNVRPMRY